MEYSADDDLQADIEIQNSSCLYFIQFLPADLPFRPQRQGAMSGGIHAVLFLGRHDAPLAASAFNEVNERAVGLSGRLHRSGVAVLLQNCPHGPLVGVQGTTSKEDVPGSPRLP